MGKEEGKQMLKRSCELIRDVLQNSHIKEWIKEIVLHPNPDGSNGFWHMTIKVVKTHPHLLTHIEHMAYTLIACCESEYLEHSIKRGVLYLS
jgi:hypothetical protein